MEALECRILGPLEVIREGTTVQIPPKQRALLALLALRRGEVVPVDELLQELWGEEAPRTAKASLQNAVSGLRRALAAAAIETSPPGYRLNLGAVRVDAFRFESLVEAARSSEPAERAGLLRDALSYWRGAPLSELGVGWAEIARLEELHLTALEDRIEADLALGEAEELVPELDALVRRHSLRERLWSQLMRALYLAGRQAEALATYRRAHEAFVEGLGIEPGPALKELQLAILLQDSGLEAGRATPTELLARAAPLLPSRTNAERAQSLIDHSVALARLGERKRARAVLEHAEAEAGRAGDSALGALIRAMLSADAWRSGDLRISDYLQSTEEAVATVEPTGNGQILAKVLKLHGGAIREAGRAADGAMAIERAVELSRAAGDQWHEGWCRNHLAFTWVLGPMATDDALRRCQEQLAALEWGPPGPLGIWAALSLLHSQLGDEEKAREFGTLAVDGARGMGLRLELAWVRFWFASALEPFDADEAEVHVGWAHSLFSAVEEDALSLSSVRAELARHAVRRNALEEADALLAAAVERLRGDIIEEQVLFHHAAGLLEERKGDPHRAVELVRRAVAFARKADHIDRLAAVLETLARLDPDSGALEEAETLYQQKGNAAALARLRNGTASIPGS